VIGIVVAAVLLVVAIAAGVVVWRRTLARGTYSGTMLGAFSVASMLGVCFGLAVGFATLLIVLVFRTSR
jgi:hypothetical protein